MKSKRMMILAVIAALLAAFFVVPASGAEATVLFSQKFEDEDVYRAQARKWEPTGNRDSAMKVDGRAGSTDRPQIRLDGMALGKEYRLTCYIKNTNPDLDLVLVPYLVLWGYNGSGYPAKDGFAQNDGIAFVGQTGDWYKYTQKIKLVDAGGGVIKMEGFGTTLQVDDAGGGYASSAFSLTTPGNRDDLVTASYCIDEFTLYNITDGADPETDPDGAFQINFHQDFNDFEQQSGKWKVDENKVALNRVPGYKDVLVTSAAGKDGGADLALKIHNRADWGDSAVIRLPEFQTGRKYRLTASIKNATPDKNLSLTPCISAWAYDGTNYPGKSDFGSEAAVIGANSDWHKYTSTFYISNDGGNATFHGFGLGIQIDNAAYAATDFRFVTGGGTGLDEAAFILDDFTIYDITEFDPENPPVIDPPDEEDDEDDGVEIGKFPLADGTFPIFKQGFEDPKTYFQTVGEKNFFSVAGKWGPAIEFDEHGVLRLDTELALKPSTVKPRGGEYSVEVANRKQWIDSARIFINNSMISANTTYRLTVYLRNGDIMKPLRLSPGINLYGAYYQENGDVGYKNASAFLPQFVDFTSLGSEWYKLTTTFTIKENKDLGTLVFSGFDGVVNVLDADAGFAAFEFMLSSPMGEDELDSCSYFIDDFSIYDITNGTDPEADGEQDHDWTTGGDTDETDETDEGSNAKTGDFSKLPLAVLIIMAAVAAAAARRRPVR